MDISNRALATVAAAAFVLVACAMLISVRNTPVRAELPADEDLLTVIPEVTRTGGSVVDPAGPVFVTAGDAERVLLVCGLYKAERAFERGTAIFASVPMGDCSLTLAGAASGFSPVFPGDRVKCAIDDERTSCTGGIATSRAARVTVSSAVPATLTVDGGEPIELPSEELRLPVGRRMLRVEYPDSGYAMWRLVVEPDQEITVHFPAPPGSLVEPAVPAVAVQPPPEPVPQVAPPSPTAPVSVDTGVGTAMAPVASGR